jgi:hypothetical protein
VSRSFLSFARIVGESYLQHHPHSRFYALVVDRLPNGIEAGCGIDVVEPAELDLPYFDELSFKYEVVELSTALKPTFFSFLLDREDAIVYLDPDILVLRRFDEAIQLLASAPIVLTPHSLSPIPRDGLRPSEEGMLHTGAYNLGFLALRGSTEAAKLLDWWEPRLRESSRVDYGAGLFYDQKWFDLVPSYFAEASILRDPTYNVAYWNLHERQLEHRDGNYLVDGRPVAFYHFSGYDPAQPMTLTKRVPDDRARTHVAPGTPLAELVSFYADLHLRRGFRTSREWDYGFACFEDGTRINRLLRGLYFDLDDEARARLGNPFAVGPGSFLDWARQPRPDGLSPFLVHLYGIRSDLPAAFPDVQGRDREAYVRWARTHGPSELGYEPDLVPAES